jgi:hypothetical protein
MLCATLQSPLRLLPVQEVNLYASGQHPPHMTPTGVLEELQRRHAYGMLVRDGERVRTSPHPGVLRATITVHELPRELARSGPGERTDHVVRGSARKRATGVCGHDPVTRLNQSANSSGPRSKGLESASSTLVVCGFRLAVGRLVRCVACELMTVILVSDCWLLLVVAEVPGSVSSVSSVDRLIL